MKLKPAQWTHHHTHRLYHLSMGLVFSFIALTVLAGLVASRSAVQADTISDSNTVGVMATVPEITPGPIGPTGGGCVFPCAPVVPPQPNQVPQTITIIPEPQSQISQRPYTRSGQNVSLYTFPTKYPAFSGHSSIASALVFVVINSSTPLYSTTRTDSSGNWFWTSPVALGNAFYTISVVAQDPNNSSVGAAAALDFVVAFSSPPGVPGQPGSAGPNAPGEPGVPGGAPGPGAPGSGPAVSHTGPLSIFLEIPAVYRLINPGEKTIVNIELINNDPAHRSAPQDIEYTIENSQHETVLRATDTLTLDKSVSFSKTFITNPQARAGDYTVIGKIETKNATAVASDTFAIRELPHAVPLAGSSRKFIDWIQILGIIILLLFALIAAIAYHNAALVSRVMRHEKELGVSSLPSK